MGAVLVFLSYDYYEEIVRNMILTYNINIKFCLYLGRFLRFLLLSV